MKYQTLEFWLLLIAGGAACILPFWPPLPAWWLLVALIWQRRYGPRCWLDCDQSATTVYAGEALICLPLLVISCAARRFTRKGGRA